MAQATSISLAKFTASVQAAVKAAVANHPKFKFQTTECDLGLLIDSRFSSAGGDHAQK